MHTYPRTTLADVPQKFHHEFEERGGRFFLKELFYIDAVDPAFRDQYRKDEYGQWHLIGEGGEDGDKPEPATPRKPVVIELDMADPRSFGANVDLIARGRREVATEMLPNGKLRLTDVGEARRVGRFHLPPEPVKDHRLVEPDPVVQAELAKIVKEQAARDAAAAKARAEWLERRIAPGRA